jgi:hypothetical protein
MVIKEFPNRPPGPQQFPYAAEAVFEIEDKARGIDPTINSPSQLGAPSLNQFDTLIAG